MKWKVLRMNRFLQYILVMHTWEGTKQCSTFSLDSSLDGENKVWLYFDFNEVKISKNKDDVFPVQYINKCLLQ